MNKKIIISLVFLLAFFSLARQVSAVCTDTDGGNAPYIRGTTTYNASVTNDTCAGNNLTEYYCQDSGIRTFQNYTCPCNSGKCVECNTSSDCEDQACKVKNCSSNTCSYSNAPDGTNCTTVSFQPKQCKAGACIGTPSCVGYDNTVNSGGSVVSSISATNADKWSAVCEDFICSGLTCEYSQGNVQNYPGGATTGTITSANLKFYNNSGSIKTRRCVYTVKNSSTGLEGTCIGTTNVKSGTSEPPKPPSGPTCIGYDYTINSGQSQSVWVSACSTCEVNRWSAVCEDFGCDGFACTYKSPTFTQTYGETAFSGGIFGANNSYSNTSGVVQSRRCTYTVWNDKAPNEKGTCVGRVNVNSGESAGATGCIGYNFTINSGQSQSAWISSSGVDRWSAICEDFNCADYACTYKSPTFTQNYYYPNGTSFSNTDGANNSYINTSGSTRTRKCNFTTWNSAKPSEKKTCVGNVNVCSAGFLWNGVSCGYAGGCVPNNNCPASKLATLCPNESCFDGCNYKAGTKICTEIAGTPMAQITSPESSISVLRGRIVNFSGSGYVIGEPLVDPNNLYYKWFDTSNCTGTSSWQSQIFSQAISANSYKSLAISKDGTTWSTNCPFRQMTIIGGPPPPPPPPTCSPKCTGTDSTACKGDVVSDGCEGTCVGTRDCTWREVTP